MKEIVTLGLAAMLATMGMAAEHNFEINVSKMGAPIQKTMYGIFFEDINYAADGGLYAELVVNRSFEFPNHLAGWDVSGKVSVLADGPFDKNPHYVRLEPAGHAHKHTMIENRGFFGMGLKGGEEYRFSVWARVPDGGKSKIWIDLVENATMGEDQKLGNAGIEVSGKEWKKYTAVLKPRRSFGEAHLRVWGDAKVTTDLEHVSLFPVDTWKGRENGMRKDLAQALADLKPGVFRFPGGCIVEGTDLETRYQWKNTVGPVENRPLNENRWHYTFTKRYFPDYYQSYGLGFFEYFQLCEDFGCEALPVISCGLSCQYQNDIRNEKQVHVAVEDLDPYIQDALDLIEFANGDVNTTWGKVRADMGHPAPFNLHYLGVGNEQWDEKDNPVFTSRLKKFMEVLSKKHPEIKYIGTTGPDSEGWKFDLLQPRMKELGVDLYDEHYYRNEEWFLGKAKDRDGKLLNCGALRYDSYDRKGPKIFAGEYACHGKGKKWNHFETSLYEAAFMTGFERNADIVHMCTYAPLFAHVKGWQWRPDMIWYDNTNMFKTCSYFVQQLYSVYKGTNVLSCTMNQKPLAGQDDQDGLFATACFDKTMNAVILKVANVSNDDQSIRLNWTGKAKDIKAGYKEVEMITLSSYQMDAENSLDDPLKIAPKTEILSNDVNVLTVPAKAFQVYVFKK